MNHILSAFLLAFSSNIDNLGLGIAYGVVTRRIFLSQNILIALVSGTGTFLSMVAGEWGNNYISEVAANALGSGILVLIGIYNIGQAIFEERKRLKQPELTSSLADPPSVVGKREAVALAISLSFNNLGGGLGAGISHVSIPLTTLLTVIFSIVAIAVGYRLGAKATLKIPKLWLGIASGLTIFILGVYELFV
jgi:putative sporulation protein YtaF